MTIDQALVKGHFFMGQVLVELGKLDEAIMHLKKGNFLVSVPTRVCLPFSTYSSRQIYLGVL